MNHKRHKPKAGRSGCLLCKPYKLNFNKTAKRRRDKKAAFDNERAAW